jgi:hypothetical protein
MWYKYFILFALLLPLKLCDEDDLAVNKNTLSANTHFTPPKFTPIVNPVTKTSDNKTFILLKLLNLKILHS